MSNPLAERTLERATSAFSSGKGVCLPELIRLLHTLSAKAQDVSVSDLADLVQTDSTILAKVIGAANTFGYNSSAKPIENISQAIHVIGYERIRMLAMSLMLVEQASRTQSPDEQREAAALALYSGFFAQNAAANYCVVDPEKVFVCASLRNFGRFVMTAIMLDEYRDAKERSIAAMDDDEAFRQVFGLTPLELGRELLRSSKLPESIMSALRDCSTKALAILDTSPDSQVLALADFSAKIAQLALDVDVSSEHFVEKTKSLAARYNRLAPGIAEQVPEILRQAEIQINQFIAGSNVGNVLRNTARRLRQRVVALNPPPKAEDDDKKAAPGAAGQTPNAASTAHAAHAQTSATFVDEPVPLNAGQIWELGLAEVTKLIEDGRIRTSVIVDKVLSLLQRGFSTEDGIVFSSESGDGYYDPSTGNHRLIHAWKNWARVKNVERTVFGVCLSKHENILIHDATDTKIAPYLPDWFRSRQLLGAFVLLPIGSAQNPHGLILIGWSSPRQIAIPPEHAKLIRALLTLLGRTYQKKVA